MQAIIISTIFFLLIGGFFWFAYSRYRTSLRLAKNYERRFKMVPMLIHLPPSSDDTEIGSRDVRDVIEEKISQAETLYSVIASTVKKGFKSNFYGQRHISFEIVAVRGVVHYYVAVPVSLEAIVKQAILSAYPTAHLEETFMHNIFNNVGKLSATIGGELVLQKDYAYPIATFREMKRDVMQSLLNALGSLGEEDGAAIQILLRPARDGWDKAVKAEASKIKKNKGKKSGFGGLASTKGLASALWKPPEASEVKPEDKQLSTLEQGTVDAIENKTRSAGYEVLIRVVASSNTAQRSQSILHNVVATFALFNAQGLNGFKFSEAKDIQNFVTAYIMRLFPPEANKNILNSVELATIFHLPDAQFTPTSQLQRQASKQVDGPHNSAKDGMLLGYNVFRGIKKEIRLADDDKRRHMYIVGQTGTGKSVLLENIALQDMLNGNGFAFIDPHGDTVETLISMVPKERTEDVIYFNPGDLEFPLGFNLFEFKTPEQKDFLIQETINMLYRLYDPQHQGIIGPRYEHWFRNAALTLMSDPKGATFIEIPKIFTDKQFLREKMKYVTDPTVLDFWNKEMAQTSDYHKSEVLGWFVSKFGAFMSNEMMRNIIGQVKSSFDLRDIMDNKKILLVNLSKGRVGELNSMLLGMMFVMKFQAAAMSRASVPESERVDFSLYVDEFQNFSTDSFASILSEARKYRLNLIVANQFIGQLTEEIRDAVFGNVGTIISLRCGATDADFLVKQYSPVFDTEDLVKLPNYNAVVRLMISGVPSSPFSMATIPPLGSPNADLGIALKQLSSAKYGKPRKQAEKEIFDRLKATAPAIPSRPGMGAARPPAAASRAGANPFGQSQAPKTPPQTPPGQSIPPAASSSFLDQWLAKRQEVQSNSQKNSVPNPTPNPAVPGPEQAFQGTQKHDPAQPVASTQSSTEPAVTNVLGGFAQQNGSGNEPLPSSGVGSAQNTEAKPPQDPEHKEGDVFKVGRDLPDVQQGDKKDSSSPLVGEDIPEPLRDTDTAIKAPSFQDLPRTGEITIGEDGTIK